MTTFMNELQLAENLRIIVDFKATIKLIFTYTLGQKHVCIGVKRIHNKVCKSQSSVGTTIRTMDIIQL